MANQSSCLLPIYTEWFQLFTLCLKTVCFISTEEQHSYSTLTVRLASETNFIFKTIIKPTPLAFSAIYHIFHRVPLLKNITVRTLFRCVQVLFTSKGANITNQTEVAAVNCVSGWAAAKIFQIIPSKWCLVLFLSW